MIILNFKFFNNIKMSFLKERILFLFESSQIFFDSFTRLFKSDMSESKFNKFRLYFLNLITEVKNHFLKKFKIRTLLNFLMMSQKLKK